MSRVPVVDDEEAPLGGFNGGRAGTLDGMIDDTVTGFTDDFDGTGAELGKAGMRVVGLKVGSREGLTVCEGLKEGVMGSREVEGSALGDVGLRVGRNVGLVGERVGLRVGPTGAFVGCILGKADGTSDGSIVGSAVGSNEGSLDGVKELGSLVGSEEGSTVLLGSIVGSKVLLGSKVGLKVDFPGDLVGVREGVLEGVLVGLEEGNPFVIRKLPSMKRFKNNFIFF